MSQREKSLHVIINFSIRAKDKIEGWRPFGDSSSEGSGFRPMELAARLGSDQEGSMALE